MEEELVTVVLANELNDAIVDLDWAIGLARALKKDREYIDRIKFWKTGIEDMLEELTGKRLLEQEEDELPF